MLTTINFNNPKALYEKVEVKSEEEKDKPNELCGCAFIWPWTLWWYSYQFGEGSQGRNGRETTQEHNDRVYGGQSQTAFSKDPQ